MHWISIGIQIIGIRTFGRYTTLNCTGLLMSALEFTPSLLYTSLFFCSEWIFQSLTGMHTTIPHMSHTPNLLSSPVCNTFCFTVFAVKPLTFILTLTSILNASLFLQWHGPQPIAEMARSLNPSLLAKQLSSVTRTRQTTDRMSFVFTSFFDYFLQLCGPLVSESGTASTNQFFSLFMLLLYQFYIIPFKSL